MYTLEVMIMSRYHPLPFSGQRYRPLLTVTGRHRILPLQALHALPTVIKGLLNRYLKFYKKINVTLVTLVTQVTDRFGNGQ